MQRTRRLALIVPKDIPYKTTSARIIRRVARKSGQKMDCVVHARQDTFTRDTDALKTNI